MMSSKKKTQSSDPLSPPRVIPSCSHFKSTVEKTAIYQTTSKYISIKRTRKCKLCGIKFHTIEEIED